MAPQRFASADKVVDRLADVSRTIRLRMDLRPVEETRVIEAFKLTAQHQIAGLKSKQVVYRDLLRHVNMTVGPYGVVLCAAALGISAVANMKDRMRVEIPTRMKEREKELSHNTVRHMASKFASNERLDPSVGQAENAPDSRNRYETPMGLQMPNYTRPETISQYAGDAYELTWQDVETIVGSKQIVGQVYLVETYSRGMNSFMLVPVSDEMTRLFAMQRAKV